MSLQTKQMEEKDIKELENHFKAIDDYFKSVVKSPRFKNPQFQIEVFDVYCENTYRVFKPTKKLLVFYKTKKDLPNDIVYGEQPYKFYNITEEQIKKLEKYYYR
jgi:hypothetical protein